jgi:hypothetical protein
MLALLFCLNQLSLRIIEEIAGLAAYRLPFG